MSVSLDKRGRDPNDGSLTTLFDQATTSDDGYGSAMETTPYAAHHPGNTEKVSVPGGLLFGARLAAMRALQFTLARCGDPLARLGCRPWQADPYPLYRAMRERGGIYRGVHGGWVVSTHQLCSAVVRERRLLVGGMRNMWDSPMRWIDTSFLQMNGKEHLRLRNLVQSAFAPKAISGYEEKIERIAHRLIDRIEAAGRDREVDLVAEFAKPLPIEVIRILLGIPDADVPRFSGYGQALADVFVGGVRSVAQARRLAVIGGDLSELFESLVAWRRHEPGDDVISSLVAHLDDGALGARELLGVCNLLTLGGFETTVSLIGNAMLALHSQRQWPALTDRPQLSAAAVEETLRYDPPVQMVIRTAREPLELGGRQVAKGAMVVALLGSAGRDPNAYPNPDTFDITRTPATHHVAFSAGPHYCLGSHLAHVEADIALRTLTERLPHLHITRPPRRLPSFIIRGPADLPVRTSTALTNVG
ncbi:cytochrome P450 [Streptomyces sirii]|uniref:cytochrome P450 n=1 Tax=Streptomyces sirii TaxID=3127701 RepID=UPI003D36A952